MPYSLPSSGGNQRPSCDLRHPLGGKSLMDSSSRASNMAVHVATVHGSAAVPSRGRPHRCRQFLPLHIGLIRPIRPGSIVTIVGCDLPAPAAQALRLSSRKAQLAIDNPSDSYAHQILAGLLGCEKATYDDAWVH
jgi:hypothetical protein